MKLITVIYIIGPISLLGSSMAAAQSFPSVWALEEAGQATLTRNANTQALKMRDRLAAGDVLKTDKNSAVRLVYESGTAIILSTDTSIEIMPSHKGIAFIKLNSGTIEGIVEKSMWVTGKPSHKLFLATPNALIAAGGTDFVADGGNTTEVHALTGAVEISPKIDDFEQAEGVTVSEGHMAISGQKGLSKPQSFDVTTYWKAFEHVRSLLIKIRRPRT